MKFAPGFAKRCALWLVLAALVHVLAVWALPRLVMRTAMSRLATGDASAVTEASAGRVRVVYPPLATAASRVIVLPSPDLGYALCVYDLAEGPVDIDAAPDWPAYWSVALYAADTDNYLVRSDVIARERPVRWRLALSPAAPTAGREEVISPSRRGIVLMRLLVADRALQASAVAKAQRALRCRPAA